MAFCGERKANGLPMCDEHYDETLETEGVVRMAPGNAVGESHWAIQLMWEPSDDGVPIEPSAEERAQYAYVLETGKWDK